MFQGPNIVIHQPDSVLDSMGEWCHKHHGQVGSVLPGLFICVICIFKKLRLIIIIIFVY